MKKNFLFLLTLLLTALPMLRAEVLTVNDGTEDNSYVPVYGLYTDSKQITQFIIPAESLEDMGEGATISKLTYYVKTTASAAWTSTFDVSLLEVSGTTIGSSYESLGSATQVYSGVLDATGSTMEVVFAQPYVYNGGNLLVDTRNQAAGNYKSAAFYGVSAPGASAESHSGSTTPVAKNFLPKVTIEYTPGVVSSCAKPTNLVMTNVASNGATATWAAAEGVSNYQYLLVAQGADLDWSAAQTVSATTVDLTGLNANTAYTFAVRSDCGAEQSNAQKVNFRTACGNYDLAVAPYSCGFETIDGFAGSADVPCFEHGKLTTSSYCEEWGLSTAAYAHNGNAAFGLTDYEYSYSYYGSYYYSSKAWVAFPQVIVPNATDYEVSFFARGNGAASGDSLAVYVNSVQSMTGATRIGGIDHTLLSDAYEQFSFTLPAGTQYVILAGYTAADDYSGGVILVDDVVMREKPNCRPATDLHVQSETPNSATFVWTPANGETEWRVKYKTSASAAYTDTTLTSPTLTVSGLEMGATYTLDYRLWSVCGGVLSPDSVEAKVNFQTSCATVVANPWNENFETAPNFGCWEMPASSLADRESNSYYSPQGSYSIKFKTTSTVYVVLPEFASYAGKRMKFAHRSEGSGSTTSMGYLTPGYLTDVSDKKTFVALGERLPHAWTATYVNVNVSSVPAGARLAFKYSDATSSTWYEFLDDITVEDMPSCRPSEDLHFVSATYNSASFVWTPANGETEWKLKYKTSASAAYVEETLTTPAFTVNGLNSGKNYTFDYRLWSVCGGVLSPDSVTGSISFQTECEVIVPVNDTIRFDFNNYSTSDRVKSSSGVLLPCWNAFISNGSLTDPDNEYQLWGFDNGSNARSGVALQAHFGYAGTGMRAAVVLPQVEVPEGSELAFWAKRTATEDSVIVWINDQPSLDGATRLGAVYPVPTNYKDAPYKFSLADIFGNKYIIFEVGGPVGSYVYFDDVTIQPEPHCQPVSNIALGEVTDSSIEFTWAKGGEETIWYVSIEDEDGNIMVDEEEMDTTRYVVTDLEAQTSYNNVIVKVVADCGDAQSPEAVVNFATIRTKCGVQALPYSENFEDYPTGTSTVAPNVDCWSFINANVGGNRPHAYISTSYVPEGKGLRFSASSSYSSYVFAVMPRFALDLRDYRLIFDSKFESSAQGVMKVGYMTDPEDETTFTALLTVPNSTTSSTNRVDLSTIPVEKGDVYIAFSFGGVTSSYYDAGIDNIRIEALPNCISVTNLKVDSTATDAVRFAWTPGKSEHQWSVEVKKGSTVIGKDTVDQPFLLVDTLQTATKYTWSVLVKAMCDGVESEEFLPAQTLSFATECDPILLSATTPWEEGFDGYASGAVYSNANVCVAEQSSISSKWTVTSTHHTGAQGIYHYYATDGYTDVLSLPLMNIPEADEYEFIFSMQRSSSSSYNDSLEVYLSNTAEAEGTRLFVSPFYYDRGQHKESTYGWYQYAVTLPAAGLKHIVLRVASSYTYSNIYLDDFMVRKIPSCHTPADIHVVDTATTETSLTFAWSGNAPQYEVKINGVSHYETEPFCVLSGLNSGTRYVDTVMVRGICQPGDTSEWSKTTILKMDTKCALITTFPWSEGFESFASSTNADDMPCWSAYWFDGTGYKTSASTAPWSVSTSYAASGSKSITSTYISSSKSLAHLVLPEMNIPEANAYEFVFTIYRPTGTSYLTDEVRVFANATPDTIGATRLKGVHRVVSESPVESAQGYYTYHVTLPNAGIQHIILQYYTYDGLSVYMDDFKVRQIPSCPGATNFRVVDTLATTSSVTMAWDGNAAQYIVSYASKDSAIVGNTIVDKDTLTITGLASGKDYEFNLFVVSKCSETDQAVDTLFAKSVKATTECAKIATLPWVEDFEDAASGKLPNCFSAFKYTSSSTDYPYVYNSSSYAYQSSKCAYFYGYSMTSSSKQMLISPEFDSSIDLSGCRVQFMYKNYNTTAGYSQFVVGTMSDPTDFSTFHPLDTLPRVSNYTAYELYLTDAPATDHYVAIRLKNGSSSYASDYGQYIDNLKVSEIPTCLPGTNLHVIDTAKTTSSVKIGWTPYSQDNLNAHIIVKNGEDTIANALVNDNAYVLTGLEASKIYTLYVQVNTVCDAIESTDALVNNRMIAETDCGIISSLPWREDFENQTDLTFNKISNCWVKPANMTSISENPHFNDYNTALEGKKSLTFNSDQTSSYCISMPQVDLGLDTVELSFLYKQDHAGKNYASLHIGVMSDPTDSATYIDVATIEQFTEKTLVDVQFANVPATHKYIAFFMPNYTSPYNSAMHYIDNVELHVVPSCYKPLDFHVKSVGQDTAVIAWKGEASKYQLALKIDTAKVYDTLVVNDTCYVLRGLTPATVYNYVVMGRSICADQDTSIWSLTKKLSFTTECAPVATLPWNEGFEDASTCWVLDDGVTFASTTYQKTGSKALKFDKQNTTLLAVLPEFAQNLSELELDYNWRCEGTGNNSSMGYLEAGYVTDVNDASTFVQLANHPEHKYTYQAEELFFPNDVPAGARIAFRYHGQTGNWYLFVDDVEVKQAPNCKKVVNLKQDTVTARSTSFSWTPSGEETKWVIVTYKGATRLDSALVETPSFSIDTLRPETAYNFTIKVMAACDVENNEFSEAVSKTFSFTTPASCPVVSNITQGAVTENSANFTWTAGGEEGSWIVKLYDADNVRQDSVEVSSNAYSINNLFANHKYTFTLTVIAKCGDEDYSKPVSKTFTFRTAMPADATEVMDPVTNREFNADFSDLNEQGKWEMLGGGSNQFMFGTAEAALLNDASAALYVSKNEADYEYLGTSYSSSIAARSIELPAVDSLRIEFDWKANGESSWDYGRAFLVPADKTLEVTSGSSPVAKIGGSQVAPGSSYTSIVPAGAIDLGNGKMNLSNTANSINKKLTDVAAGTYKLVFVWGNDNSTANQNPLSICNVSVKILDELPIVYTKDTTYSLVVNEQVETSPYTATSVAVGTEFTCQVMRQEITYANGVEFDRDTTYLGVAEGVVLDRLTPSVVLEGTEDVVVTADAVGDYTFTYVVADNTLTVTFPGVTPTGMDALTGSDSQKIEKVLINGQVYILRGGQIFTIMGHSVDHVE